MQKVFGKISPAVAGGIVAIVYILVPQLNQYRIPGSMSALLGATVSIAGIAVGFLVTARSILISVHDRRIVKRLKATPHWQSIVTNLRVATSWAFGLAVLSAAGLIIDWENSGQWTPLLSSMFGAWLLVAVATTVASQKIIFIFNEILSVLDSESFDSKD